MKRKTISLSLSEVHENRLKLLCEKEGCGPSELIRRAIDLYFKKETKNDPRQEAPSRLKKRAREEAILRLDKMDDDELTIELDRLGEIMINGENAQGVEIHQSIGSKLGLGRCVITKTGTSGDDGDSRELEAIFERINKNPKKYYPDESL